MSPSPQSTHRYYIIFRGRVQGVGFRWSAVSLARSLGLTGWVRNLDNGDVDCEVQGAPERVRAFVNGMKTANQWINIQDYSIKRIPVQADTRDFFTRN